MSKKDEMFSANTLLRRVMQGTWDSTKKEHAGELVWLQKRAMHYNTAKELYDASCYAASQHHGLFFVPLVIYHGLFVWNGYYSSHQEYFQYDMKRIDRRLRPYLERIDRRRSKAGGKVKKSCYLNWHVAKHHQGKDENDLLDLETLYWFKQKDAEKPYIDDYDRAWERVQRLKDAEWQRRVESHLEKELLDWQYIHWALKDLKRMENDPDKYDHEWYSSQDSRRGRWRDRYLPYTDWKDNDLNK
jgi:hypothetical protein